MNQHEGTPIWQPGQTKLLDRVRDRCRVRHLALSTEHAYMSLNIACPREGLVPGVTLFTDCDWRRAGER